MSSNFGKCNIYFVSERGRAIAETIFQHMDETGSSCKIIELKSKPGKTLLDLKSFKGSDVLIFISSTAVAVRAIAPHIKDKQKDPAVIAIDETAKFVVPVIGGHIRRANELASDLAGFLGGTAAITTASDNLSVPALDVFAESAGLKIRPSASYKSVATRLNAGEKALFVLDKSDQEQNADIIKELGSTFSDSYFIDRGSFDPNNSPSGPMVCLKDASYCLEKNLNCDLVLSPKKYAIGLGFRKDAPASDLVKAIKKAIMFILEDAGIDIDEGPGNLSIKDADIKRYRSAAEIILCISTIDIKKGAPELESASESVGIPTKFFKADDLEDVISRDKLAFSTSKPAFKNLGINGVCEPVAVLATSNGKLIMKKRILWGVTVAVARENCL